MTKTIKKLNLLGIVFLAIFALSTLPVVAKDDAEETPKEITSLNELLLKVQEEALYDSEKIEQESQNLWLRRVLKMPSFKKL